MKQFIHTGVHTQGCIIPITTEDPCLELRLDEYSEDFRINIYAGNEWIAEINSSHSLRNIDKDVSSLPVYNNRGECLGNVCSLIKEQMFWDYLRIHSA